jgi:hypothetical protein
METTSALKLYSLGYKEVKTYLLASAFIIGNIVLPQLCHLVPNGGITLLPIYFFTLVAAYKYGWKAGLLVAVLSPVINSLLFGMPVVALLPVIVIKSTLLAIAASLAAGYFKRISIPILLMVVLAYQLTGVLAEWMIEGSFYVAIQDFRIGVPGMLLQIFGGYFLIKYLIKQ